MSAAIPWGKNRDTAAPIGYDGEMTTPTPIKPELLSPAGSPEALAAALDAGADAVYLGLQAGLNARRGATNFSPDELAAAVEAAAT